MVASRGGNYTARPHGHGQPRHLVVRAAQFKREHRLHVFALQEERIVQPGRQIGRALKRRFARDIVDACSKNAFQIIDFHPVILKR
jgi:hypothetical protein